MPLIRNILPVVVTHSVTQGLQIAEGLLTGGIAQIEITLRTPVALDVLRAIALEFPDMALCAGTVLSPDQFEAAADHGATFFLSPGLTETLAQHAVNKHCDWVPGVATASEAMRALEWGFQTLKFFPAMAAGGPVGLAGICAPLPRLEVIPTGGITLQNLADWKAVPSVVAVGGTWLTAKLDDEADVTKTVATRAAQALQAWHGLN